VFDGFEDYFRLCWIFGCQDRSHKTLTDTYCSVLGVIDNQKAVVVLQNWDLTKSAKEYTW
jgi:hypothetical protein